MNLSREIIKQVLADVGVLPGSNFGKSGLTLPEFKLDKKLVVHYDDGQKAEFPLWAGIGSLSDTKVTGSKVKVLLADVSDDVTEFALALRVDDKPIYALRLAFDNEDPGDFLLQQGENWIGASMLIKAWALVGMEMIVDQGVLWEPTTDYKDLYEAVSHLVEM